MGLIKAAAYLEMCPICGMHGRIVFSNGTKSTHFATRFRGEAYLSAALTNGLITDEEAKFVSSEIYRKIQIRSSFKVDAMMDSLSELKGSVHEFDLSSFVPENTMMS